jgi:hypothetical protein
MDNDKFMQVSSDAESYTNTEVFQNLGQMPLNKA